MADPGPTGDARPGEILLAPLMLDPGVSFQEDHAESNETSTVAGESAGADSDGYEHRSGSDESAQSEGEDARRENPDENGDAESVPERAPYDSSEDLAYAVGCAALSFAVYFKTLYPHVPGGDSGELIASAFQLGVAHPPGYPLFILVEKLVASLLVFGSVAWRMNVGMALVGAAAVGVMYLTAAQLAASRGAALLAAGLLALNPIVWTYSTHAEVFPLNNLLVAILLYLSVASWGAFIMGLGLTNQHTMLVYEVPLALAVLVAGRKTLLAPGPLLRLFLLFCLGFSVYLYMPLATLRMPYVSWGDATSLDGFLRHILRKEYGSFRLSADEKEPGRLWEGLHHWAMNVVEQNPPGLALLAPLGLGAHLLRAFRGHGRSAELWLDATLMFYLVFFHALANLPLYGRPDHIEIIRRFWMQSACIEVLIIASGADAICTLLPANLRGAPFSVSVAALLVGWAAVQWEVQDQSDNYVVEQFGREVLSLMPPNALFLTMTDLVTNSLRYLQVCHHYRQDVFVADQNLMSALWFVEGQAHNFPGVNFPARLYWPSRPDGFNMHQMVDNNFGKFRIFTFAGAKDQSYENAGYKMVPYGYAEEFTRGMDENNLSPWQCNESMWAETVEQHMPRSPPYANLSI
ncbi:hypothetical protein T484DRAFT_1806647, partial [Baffinella frigidus]